MALIDRIRDVNRRYSGREYFRLYANAVPVGFVDTQLLDDLQQDNGSDLFALNHAAKRIDMRFSERKAFEAEIAAFFKAFFARKKLSGWRNEYYAVSENYTDETLFLLERAALSYLGMTGYGVHVNGYVETSAGLAMWVAKRALSKPTSPGKLDQIAAGGQPHDLSVWDNMLKECEEEASIPASLACQAKAVSAVSYCYDLSVGMRPDVIFNYDLKLPADFVPQVNDGEVDSFTLYPMSELLTLIAETRDFKFNSAVVVIDFAIRHGLLTPEHRDYLALQTGMNLRGQYLDALR